MSLLTLLSLTILRWDGLTMVHIKPYVERVNRDIEDMLSIWLDSLRLVHVRKYRTYLDGVKCSSYAAMFREPINIGFKTSNLPNDEIVAYGLEIFSTYLFYDEEFESEFRFY